MKKLILPLSIIVLLGFATLVLAGNYYYVSDTEKIMYTGMVSDKWNLVPFMDTSWSSRISEDTLSDKLKEQYHPENEFPFVESDIYVAYVYDSLENKYIQTAGKGTDTAKLQTINYDDVSRYPAMWVYYKTGADNRHMKDIWFKIKPENMPKISDFTMKKGWNFVWWTSDVKDKSINDAKGTCDIVSLAGWIVQSDGNPAKWEIFDVSNPEVLNSHPNLGNMFIVKVSNDCQLKVSGESLPQVPNLP